MDRRTIAHTLEDILAETKQKNINEKITVTLLEQIIKMIEFKIHQDNINEKALSILMERIIKIEGDKKQSQWF